MTPPRLRAPIVLTLLASLPLSALQAEVIINEVHYNGEPNTAKNEFVELHNTGGEAVDVSGWFFNSGIEFEFPPATEIPGNGYLVIAENPPSLLSEFGVTALGPFGGGLSGQGETLELRRGDGTTADSVSYKARFPWPIGAAGTGASMELINPSLDNDLGGAWRSSTVPGVLPELTLIPSSDSGWSWRPGDSEASAPTDAWRDGDFVEDGTWTTQAMPVGYGGVTALTFDPEIEGMRGNYSSVYLRKEFTVAPGEIPQALLLRFLVDDGLVVWINGSEVERRNLPAGDLPLSLTATALGSETNWVEKTLDGAAGYIVEGSNTIALRLFNSTLSSSDCGIDLELIRPATDDDLPPKPTPGARNSTFASNAPPFIRQVDHSPKQPAADEAVTITAKVTDPDGVAPVTLEVQSVAPGAYVPAFLAKPHSALLSNPNGPRDPNPAYHDAGNWTAVAMVDDGSGGDAVAGDDIFTAVVPGENNRTLVRYRIVVEDTPGATLRVPYADDPSLNFAYYVYNGVPDFIADTRSVAGQVPYTHPKEVLTSLPVYTMLTTQADFDQCVAYSGTTIPSNNFDARSAFNWGATFVYDGVVYDNIAYRLRQRNARYAGGGKRSFRFRFNEGNFIQLHDDEGDPYPTEWRSINSHKMTGSRGGVNFGLYEAANAVLWNLTDSPAPFTNWFHFRVVKGTEEQPAGTNGQHLGDFYGLMLAMEDYDLRYLDSHDLGRGNLYKLKTGGNDGLSVQRYQAKDAVDDGSDFRNIINQLRNSKSDQWLRDHVNWDSYYKYKVIVDAVRHYDVSNGITTNNGEHLKNRSFFFQPDPTNPLGKVNLMPWDSDTSWGPNWNGGWDWPKNAMDDRDEFNKEYKNVVREFRDLVWQEDQIIPMLDVFQSKLEEFQVADRDRWTGATGSPNPGSQSDGPMSTRVADMKKFAFDGGSWSGGSSANRDFVYNASGTITASDSISRDDGISGQQGRDAYLDALAFDPSTPNKPTITYTGDAGFPTDRLSFEASAYSDPQGAATFAAMEWRIAEVTPIGGGVVNFFDAGQDWKYLDNGSNQGTAWREVAFSDDSWASGPAPLGYGGISNTDLATTIDFGPDTGNKFVTTYFRRTLMVPDPDLFETFAFKLHADDGALVFVNGIEVVRDRFNAGTDVNFDTFASSNGNEGVFDEFEVDSEFFVAGTNIIAVELHQRSSSSSDMVFDMALEATERTIPAGANLLFEWNASWQSGELASEQAQIEVPTTATREGRLYRARVRHRDDTDRWSNWSEPVQFTTTSPDIQLLLDHLVISELMYHPSAPTPAEANAGFADQDDFEFIELLNVSETDTLLLTDVRFTKGVDFDISPGTMLAPGERLLVVRNRAAFEFRYGAGLPIAGEYQANAEANLSNSGERLKLSFGGGIPIRDFEYDDVAPWPTAADGSGRSLVLISPVSVPDHAVAANWRSSGAANGSPGAEDMDTGGFVGDPLADDNGNGIPNLVEYAAGAEFSVGLTSVDGFDYPSISFDLNTDATDADVVLELSDDLLTWRGGEGEVVLVSENDNGDGTVTQTWRTAQPVGTAAAFMRVRAEIK